MSFSVEEGGPIGFTTEIELYMCLTNYVNLQATSWDVMMLQRTVQNIVSANDSYWLPV